MATISNRLLHVRRNLHSYSHPYAVRNFSSSHNSSDGPPSDESRPSSFSAYFNEVKSSLHNQSSPPQNRQQQPPPRKPFSFTNRPPSQSPSSKVASLEEIRRNLSEFRVRTSPPPPTSPSSGQSVSLQDLYNKNISSKGGGLASPPNSKPNADAPSPPSFDAIRETLRRLKETAPSLRGQIDHQGKPTDQLFTNFKLKPDSPGQVSNFPSGLYGKERVAWGSAYGYQDLGEKLESLRPDKRKGKWFSLQELSDRLAKLRDIENKSSEEGIGVAVKDIRESLKKMIKPKEERPRIGQSILESMVTPSFMLSPPKEQLVEKFFHPDNMSAAEKLKLELKQVRDEFKMSESDCGSFRVQVAQLTTKIKYLSQVLPKKDKHSRKGLNGMVQRRKKLLKYLRRTDWDSYCLLLSKLGLRDNPDLKS